MATMTWEKFNREVVHDVRLNEWIRKNPPPDTWPGDYVSWAYAVMPIGIITKVPGWYI